MLMIRGWEGHRGRSGGGCRSVVSLLLSRLWLNLVLVWPKKSAGGNFRDISLELFTPSQCFERGIENREQTGGQGTLGRIYGCVPAHNVRRTAHVPNDPRRQRAMLDGICGLAGTAIPQEAEPGWNLLPLPFWDNHNNNNKLKKKEVQGIKIQQRQRGRPTETGNVLLRQRRGGETPGKTQD